MQQREPSYVPFEQILAFCEGNLSEAAAEQLRQKAIYNPLIQETITNLQRYLQSGSSQKLQAMIDQSLDQFLTQSLAGSFQLNTEASIPKPWYSSIPLLPRGGNTWMRPALILGSIVLVIVLGHMYYQSSVLPAGAEEELIASDPTLSADAIEHNQALDPGVIQNNESLVFPGETKAPELTTNDPTLGSPDDLSAAVAGDNDILNSNLEERAENLVFPAETIDPELTANDPTLSYSDDLTTPVAGNDGGLNPSGIQEDENPIFPIEATGLDPITGDSTLLFPGGFSPNGDGNNDVFKPKLLRKIKVFHEFSIYNRWGEQVYTAINFSPKSRKKEWDGIFQGEPAEEGTYVFVVRLQNALGFEETFTGNFVLMR